LVISGPTGVGKTDLSIEVAEKIGGEIICADSVQIYKFLDIGTGKPSREWRERIPHYMVDILDPKEEYNAFSFAQASRRIIQDIYQRGKIPLLVGGCGFYIKAVMENILSGPGGSLLLREKLRKECEEKGVEFLYAKLREIDPARAREVHPHDKFRVIRGLEVFYLTGKPFSLWKKERKEEEKYSSLFLALIRERKELYLRIEERVERMWEEGWVGEVRRLLEAGYPEDSPGLRSLGYREIVEFIKGKRSEEETKEEIKKKTKNYARRQIIWLRKENPVWIKLEEERERVFRLCEEFLKQVK